MAKWQRWHNGKTPPSGRRFLHTKKQEERPLAFPPVHKRSGIDFFLEHTAFLGGIIVGVAGLFVFLLLHQYVPWPQAPMRRRNRRTWRTDAPRFPGTPGSVECALALLPPCRAGDLRIFQHGAGTQHVFIEGLSVVVGHEERASERVQQGWCRGCCSWNSG